MSHARTRDAFEGALDIWQRSASDDPLSHAETLGNLALLRQNQSRHEEAIELYKLAVPIFEKEVDRFSVSAARARYNQAASWAALGNFDNAIALYQEALLISEDRGL